MGRSKSYDYNLQSNQFRVNYLHTFISTIA